MDKRTLQLQGSAIARLRRGKGWSQERLAQEARCDKRTIERFEQGGRGLLDLVGRVARALEVDLQGITTAASDPDAPRDARDEALEPFIAGPPILHPRRFFGRTYELRRLFGLWRGLPLQNAAIVGPRRSGKTSLLRYLAQITTAPAACLRPGQRTHWLPEPARYRWIFVDFQDPRLQDREGLLRYLLDRMDLPAPHPCDLGGFLDTVSQGLRTPTLVLLDEIGVVLQSSRLHARAAGQPLDDLFWEGLRALASHQVGGRLGFVLGAQEPPMLLAQHTGHSSPFFNIFGFTATLGPLTRAEAIELIASAPIAFPPPDIDWILGHSQGWPVLLQILCRERLLTLEDGMPDTSWREEGLRQMAPFRSLLTPP